MSINYYCIFILPTIIRRNNKGKTGSANYLYLRDMMIEKEQWLLEAKILFKS